MARKIDTHVYENASVECCLMKWAIHPLRLRRCPARLSIVNKPSLALACCLWEVEPLRDKDWDMEAIQLFALLVKDTKLQLFVISYEKLDNITKCQVS